MRNYWLCRIGLHRWNKWEDKSLRAVGDDVDRTGQTRFCWRCNKKEARKVTVSYG